MDNSEHRDKTEIAACISNSQGQPCLKHQDTAPQGVLVPEISDETTHEQERLLTHQIRGAFFQYHTLMQNLMLLPENISAPKK